MTTIVNAKNLKTLADLINAEILNGIGDLMLVRQKSSNLTTIWRGINSTNAITLECFSKKNGDADLQLIVQKQLPNGEYKGLNVYYCHNKENSSIYGSIVKITCLLINKIRMDNNLGKHFDESIKELQNDQEVKAETKAVAKTEVKETKAESKRIQFKAPGATFEISQDVWLFVNYMTNDKHLLGHETNFGYVCESTITAKDVMYYDFAKAIKGRGGWGVDEFSKAISKIRDTKNEYGLSFGFEEGFIRLSIIPIEKQILKTNDAWTRGATSLMHAVNARNFTQVKSQILNTRVDVLALNEQGKTAYDLATEWFGEDDAITEFLKKVDYDARVAAADERNRKLATAKINQQDLRGFTPLMRAIEKGDDKEVKRLLEAGANIQLKSNEGLDAWAWSERCNGMFHNITEMINEVSFHTLNIDRKCEALKKKYSLSDMDLTLLKLSEEGGRSGEFPGLINRGANINCIDKNGYTPLMLAALVEKYVSAQVLIDLGADMDILCNGKPGKDALGLCIAKFGKDCMMVRLLKKAKFLKENGCKPNPVLECKVISADEKNETKFDYKQALVDYPELKNILAHLEAGNIGLAKDCLKKIIG